MKSLINFFILLAIICAALVSIYGTVSKYTAHHFMAYIVQDGKQIPIENHIAKVKKAPFKVVVDMPDKTGVFVNISNEGGTFHSGLKNVSASKLKGFSKPAIYEYWKNSNKELLISKTKPNFWFIETAAKSRFSSYEKVNGRYICSREVEQLYDVDLHKKVPLGEVKGDVYFTFIKFEANGENIRNRELMRHNFKIKWIDE